MRTIIESAIILVRVRVGIEVRTLTVAASL